MQGFELDMQIGTSPANAIRASRTTSLHKQAVCKTASPLNPHPANSCFPGDVHVRPYNVVVAALANKLARTAWAVLAKGKAFDPLQWNPTEITPA